MEIKTMTGGVDIDVTGQQITPHLRWHNGILQQAWSLTHYRAGVPHKMTTEWRDVPQSSDPGQSPP